VAKKIVITIEMRVSDIEQFRRLAKRFEKAADELQERLVKALRKPGGDALRAVKRAWLGVEVESSRDGQVPPDNSTGLRARIAGATEMEDIRRGVRFEVEHKRVDSRYGRTLVFGMDNLARWRHPVFGDPDIPWEQQNGEEVFYSTLIRFEPKFRKALLEEMKAIADYIVGKG
jgi:hypothetical protein